VSAAWRSLLLLGFILGAGWLAAASAGVALWEQVAALAALALVVYRVARATPAASIGIWGAVALALAAAGLALGLAWPAALAAAIVAARTQPDLLARRRLALWALMAVPWLATDAAAIGWFFRWSGAWATEGFFHGLGFAVTRQGTWLQVEDQPLAVDAACAGIDTLQATLVAGLWMAESLRTVRGWSWGIALLPLLAWVANTLRIILLGSVALTSGYETATGWFHAWGGLGVIVLVFALAAAWVGWLRRQEAAP
jgi:exosortase/archaeosortase family protein